MALDIKDIPWVGRQLWAPDAAFKNGKYYLYFPAKDKSDVFRIGVATSTTPVGPFKAEAKPIEGSYSIDPAVFQDADGTSYMYFGGSGVVNYSAGALESTRQTDPKQTCRKTISLRSVPGWQR
ncbi:MAG: family 43 glycosylhydrolase [Bacteroidota bacterium]